MGIPLNINIQFTGDFRQEVLKLANTYEPTFDMPEYFKNLDEMIDQFSSLICEDFCDLLLPLIREKLEDRIRQQML